MNLQQELASLNQDVTFIHRATELPALLRAGKMFSLALLPANSADWEFWALWGELALLNPRPELLFYARSANFQTWCGVLEAGGHDLLTEPFSAPELRSAVAAAHKTFEERIMQERSEGSA